MCMCVCGWVSEGEEEGEYEMCNPFNSERKT